MGIDAGRVQDNGVGIGSSGARDGSGFTDQRDMGIDAGRVRWDGASDRSDGDQQDDLILAAIPCWHGLAGVAVPLFSACSR